MKCKILAGLTIIVGLCLLLRYAAHFSVESAIISGCCLFLALLCGLILSETPDQEESDATRSDSIDA